MADIYFVRSDAVKEKAVGPDVALYVDARRSIHVLNESARFIWESLREPVTFDELLFMMSQAFDVQDDVLRRDLEETLQQFRELDLVHTTGA